ncbi:hypothetical protein Ae505Ps2_2673c [Pseudonocardia sp. Ae505_Ps2]|nr:hypothetical protein Ae505Ps2_2673c [Pseudonocardia sp. Ae505_Ps2]
MAALGCRAHGFVDPAVPRRAPAPGSSAGPGARYQ